MATYSKVHLSESDAGQPIKVAATSTPGTSVHTTGISANDIDEVWIYANNTSNADEELTVEYGGATSPDNLIKITMEPSSGLVLILPGLILSGDDSSGKTISAFSSNGNVINITGYINRIS